jgi:ubiquitin carboxyl-terminal hydrolase 4/11/15
LIPRSTSSLSSHPMLERTYSHKSDGRQSSTGHSVHSVASRANSLGIDTFTGLGSASLEGPALTPGLFILGTVPSIIRCWLNTKFKHESLLYAAVCTGSYTSYIDKRLVDQLGFSDQIRLQDDTSEKLKLRVYLPEAVVRSASSRSSSPAPQLPTLTVDFTVVSQQHNQQDKSIQVFIGSDILRAHNADILFSSNNITLFDDEHSKLSIPMVRPEDASVFKGLQVSGCLPPSNRPYNERSESVPDVKALRNGREQSTSGTTPARDLMERKDSTASLPSGNDEASRPTVEPRPSSPVSRSSTDSRPALVLLTSQSTNVPATETSATRTAGSSPAIWGKWRRGSDKDNQNEWGSATESNYQRREQGIKVLRPLKSTSRAVSGTQPTSGSPGPAQSRFFEEGKRRVSGDRFDATTTSSAVSGPATFATKDGAAKGGSKPAAAGSAFSWLAK